MNTVVGVTIILAIATFLVAQYRENKKSNREFGGITKTIEYHGEKIIKNEKDINALGAKHSRQVKECSAVTNHNGVLFAEIKAGLSTLVNQGETLSDTIDKNATENRVKQEKIEESIKDMSKDLVRVTTVVDGIKEA